MDMKSDYKRIFDKITPNESDSVFLKNVVRKAGAMEKNHKISKKSVAAFAAVGAAAVLTISVGAVNSWDYAGIFGRLFGENTENVEKISAVPKVNILSNTFEKLEFEFAGIAGDSNTMFLIMDITATDGTILPYDEKVQETIYTGYTYTESIPYRFGDATSSSSVRSDGVEESYHWLALEDENPNDNKITLAYVYNTNQPIRGNTLTLDFKNFSGAGGTVSFDGELIAELTADYPECKELTFEPDATTEFALTENITEIEVGDFEKLSETLEWVKADLKSVVLSDVSLDYTFILDDSLFGCSGQYAYLEMTDGSLIGSDDAYIASNGIDRKNTVGSGEDITQGGEKKTQMNMCWIFEYPINTDNVKAIHIGKDYTLTLR